MPSSSVVHAAVFAAGALVGGGLATAVGASRNRSQLASPATKPGSAPVVDVKVEPSGATRVSPTGAAGTVTPLTPLPAILKYGNPGPIADQLVRTAYVAGYDRRLRHPAWTAEHLTLAKLGKSLLDPPSPESEGGDRSNSTFTEDESLPAMFRARLKDYFRSGYDRGHMVPAADAKMSQTAMNETFLLSNIAPQVGEGFNRHYWAYLEDWCRRLTGAFADVYVFTVPLYLPKQDPDGKWRVTHEVIGNPPNVAVPTHFAKVVLASRPSSPATPTIPEISTGAFVLPNAVIKDETPLESFVVPIEAVERAAGLTLFSDEVKKGSKHICQTARCEVVVRRFDDARKRPEMRRAISAPAK
ncbi:hypothetical protein GLOTRDRAFT_123726 [Gloeophyllum trabeum ATCC 11539]|uniref:Endonuclease n=1 Tax=Gloeophyllum trabeum (strain ATCC 11539 / FP-39264 / Madison 617) TaxID=670483 RepID=S7S5X9_GLOTA|nr:uncharacterized protein GLOTRDRAFT_123726 [Gloeophyllum trabeum ATCC 11539]EPQ61434.1 hypothetical protein GLOTRDRAFT_123726 [Gloeophyllum trabeum ATCC 11539]